MQISDAVGQTDQPQCHYQYELALTFSRRAASRFFKGYGPIAQMSTSPFAIKSLAAIRYPNNSLRRKRYRKSRMASAALLSALQGPLPGLRSFLLAEYGHLVLEKILCHFNKLHLIDPLPDITSGATVELLRFIEKEIRILGQGLSQVEQPDVSIVIPVHNNVLYTLSCVRSLLLFPSQYTSEILIGDECSTDLTFEIFSNQMPGLRYIRYNANLGFLTNCNATARFARGRWLVFLNNYTIVLPGWLDALIDTLRDNADVGLVGSRLISPDGRLQEAGGIVFADGSALNFGRTDHPSDPRFTYMRDADYCSGASIALPRDLWCRLGGFDERFTPAYHAETDLAFRIREDQGLRVVYQPTSALIHLSGVSHATSTELGLERNQELNQQRFFNRWKSVLPGYGTKDPNNLPTNRACRGRVLFIDGDTPFPDRDSGSIHTLNYLKILKSFGLHVTFVPHNLRWRGQYSQYLRRIGIEVLVRPFWSRLRDIIQKLGPTYDLVFLLRAPIAAELLELVRKHAPSAKVIFDTVDLHHLRLEREAKVTGSRKARKQAAIMKHVEMDVIRRSDATIVLSSFEAELLAKLVPDARVRVIPFVREITPRKPVPFEKRRDVLFVGGFRHRPNVDAVHWFVSEVWPLIRARGLNARFIIVGSHVPPEVQALSRSDIEVKGYVPDLTEILDKCRVSVAPLRYGAGLKGKVISSFSHGVPVVGTQIAIEGSGLEHGLNVLVADTPEAMADSIVRLYQDPNLWETLSRSCYDFCLNNFSIQSFERKLRKLIQEVCPDLLI